MLKTDELADLALLQLSTMPRRLKTVPLGSMEDAKVGADVHAIGHPAGENWTYTKGIISQIRPDYDWQYESGAFRATVIQTQTPINPGNSGGPLLTDDARLIGVNSFVHPDYPSLNYAVSVADVIRFLESSVSRESKGSAIACEPRYGDAVLDEGLDRYVISADRDCNNKTDIWYVFLDLDALKLGKSVYMLIDSNEDKIIDLKIIEEKGVGNVWVYYDKRQQPTAIAYDYDQDGLPDRYTAP